MHAALLARALEEALVDWGQRLYHLAVIDDLRAAVEALNDGNIEPFVALIDENCEWRGITRGHLWWKHAPG